MICIKLFCSKVVRKMWFVVFNLCFLSFSSSSPDGELYAGTSVDFMGANAAIFRTSVQGDSQHYIRTEAYDHNWLNGEKHWHQKSVCVLSAGGLLFQNDAMRHRWLTVKVLFIKKNNIFLSLSEPEFVGSFSIPDTHSPDDDKVYFFFKERAVEAGQWDKRVYSRVARVCKVRTQRLTHSSLVI